MPLKHWIKMYNHVLRKANKHTTGSSVRNKVILYNQIRTDIPLLQ